MGPIVLVCIIASLVVVAGILGCCMLERCRQQGSGEDPPHRIELKDECDEAPPHPPPPPPSDDDMVCKSSDGKPEAEADGDLSRSV